MKNRNGFSLLIVLIISAAMLFIATVFTDSTMRSLATAQAGLNSELVSSSADAALILSLNNWNRADAAALRVGETDSISVETVLNMVTQVTRTRLQSRSFLIQSHVQISESERAYASRQIARYVRIDWPSPHVSAAINSAGVLSVGAGASIAGADAVPAGWESECSSDMAHSPIAASAAYSINVNDSADISGHPHPYLIYSSEELQGFVSRFDSVYSVLTSQAVSATYAAEIDLSPIGGSGSQCPSYFGNGLRNSVSHNDCSRRWPIVHSRAADVRLRGSMPAQGTLLVDGNLLIDENVTFSGLIMVRGDLQILVPPGQNQTTITGAVLIKDEEAGGSSINGNARVQSGRCPLRMALSTSADVVPVMNGGWFERH